MSNYNWKKHYAAALKATERTDGFERYRIENETGSGIIASCVVSPGLQVVMNDLTMLSCCNTVARNKDIIELNYCMDGRYECSTLGRYSFSVTSGDFSVGYAGRKEASGGFPTGHYRGINVFLDLGCFSKKQAEALLDDGIDLSRIRALAARQPRYFVLHRNSALNQILRSLSAEFEHRSIPGVRENVLAILRFLSRPEAEALEETPAYLSKRNVELAKAAQAILVRELPRHVTIEQLAFALDSGTTALKKSFKSVYGASIYQYQKDLRLLEAQRLLRETEEPISSVALSAGYTNPAKFASAFKARFGLTPSAYQASLRQS
ncbi:MAG: helix-turn-helix transcriptional regulator [Ruminococcaceae bacterium]|nr:helix-turn-helix transcriptional regulator [Oscillospiraceae bacterium]